MTRSLVTLKALTYRPTGGIIAAATTSLPERIGGERNWDYRYCWIRDSTFTLYALLTAGFRAEANDWREWMLRAAAGHPSQLQIMYGIAGERRLEELELPWLAGYENSRPVRIGNAAADQLQLDVYGELMDSLHVARKFELPTVGGKLEFPENPARQPQKEMAAARQGHLGDPRRIETVHALEADGLGGLRPCHQGSGGFRPVRPGGGLAGAPRDDQGRHPATWVERQAQELRAGLWRRCARRLAAAVARSSASCRRRIRASSPRSRRSSAS